MKFIEVDLGLRPFFLDSVSKRIIGADILSKFGIRIDHGHKRLVDSQTSLNVCDF